MNHREIAQDDPKCLEGMSSLHKNPPSTDKRLKVQNT